MGRKCKRWLRKFLFTPFMGCAQIDHTPYGLVRPPGVAERPGDVRLAPTEAERRPLPGALSGRSQPRGAMTFPLRPTDYPFVSFASGCIPEKTAQGCIRPQRLPVPPIHFTKYEQGRELWRQKR